MEGDRGEGVEYVEEGLRERLNNEGEAVGGGGKDGAPLRGSTGHQGLQQ